MLLHPVRSTTRQRSGKAEISEESNVQRVEQELNARKTYLKAINLVHSDALMVATHKVHVVGVSAGRDMRCDAVCDDVTVLCGLSCLSPKTFPVRVTGYLCCSAW
jgi:AICAR transformylase/IMP cyclohydrolase PurH